MAASCSLITKLNKRSDRRNACLKNFLEIDLDHCTAADPSFAINKLRPWPRFPGIYKSFKDFVRAKIAIDDCGACAIANHS